MNEGNDEFILYDELYKSHFFFFRLRTIILQNIKVLSRIYFTILFFSFNLTSIHFSQIERIKKIIDTISSAMKHEEFKKKKKKN